MFASVLVGQLDPAEAAALATLRPHLEAHAEVPLKPGHPATIGFFDPYGEQRTRHVEIEGGGFVAWLRLQERKPNAKQLEQVLKQGFAQQKQRLQDTEQRAPTQSEREALEHELRLKVWEATPTQETVIPVYLGDPSGEMFVGVHTKARRDEVLGFLGRALHGRLGWHSRLNAATIQSTLTRWVMEDGAIPAEVGFGEEVHLNAPDTKKASIKVKHLAADITPVKVAISERGMQVEKIALTTGPLAYTLDASGALTRLALTPDGQQALFDQLPEDLAYDIERALQVRWQVMALRHVAQILSGAFALSPSAEGEQDLAAPDSPVAPDTRAASQDTLSDLMHEIDDHFAGPPAEELPAPSDARAGGAGQG